MAIVRRDYGKMRAMSATHGMRYIMRGYALKKVPCLERLYRPRGRTRVAVGESIRTYSNVNASSAGKMSAHAFARSTPRISTISDRSFSLLYGPAVPWRDHPRYPRPSRGALVSQPPLTFRLPIHPFWERGDERLTAARAEGWSPRAST